MDEVVLPKREKTNRDIFFTKCEFDIMMKIAEAEVCPIKVISGQKYHGRCSITCVEQRCPHCIQEWLNKSHCINHKE